MSILLFRGFKIVGPFVVMIYNMIAGDLLRWIIIYLVFIIGFSQGMYMCTGHYRLIHDTCAVSPMIHGIMFLS